MFAQFSTNQRMPTPDSDVSSAEELAEEALSANAHAPDLTAANSPADEPPSSSSSTSDEFAICSLVATVLALDFVQRREHNRLFAEHTLTLICAEMGFDSADQRRTMLAQLRDAPARVTDLVIHLKTSKRYDGPSVIARMLHGVLKSGTFVLVIQSHSPHCSCGLLCVAGCYDSRARSLLKHVGALFAVANLDSIEDTVAHLLIEETFVESE